MSGHSHAKTVRRIKEADAKIRGKIFSKMTRAIWVAVKEGGSNPETNSKLRLAIESARSINMPKDNMERAIKRATGKIPGEKLEEITFEAYGPGGIAIIIEGITDNKNRTLGEIKQVLNQNNGKLVGEGRVQWMFERKGCLTLRIIHPVRNHISNGAGLDELRIKNKEELELLAIETGAQDLYWHGDILDVYTKPEDLEKVKKNLEGNGITIESASLDWVAKEKISLPEKAQEACQKLFEDLDELESVQEIYSNLNPV